MLRAAGDWRLATAISGFVENRALSRQPVPQQAPLADLLVNELFRVQQTCVGSKLGTDAPLFVRGWAADKDLGNPRNEGPPGAVFLTRNQLQQSRAIPARRAGLGEARATGAAQSLFDQRFGPFPPRRPSRRRSARPIRSPAWTCCPAI